MYNLDELPNVFGIAGSHFRSNYFFNVIKVALVSQIIGIIEVGIQISGQKENLNFKSAIATDFFFIEHWRTNDE